MRPRRARGRPAPPLVLLIAAMMAASALPAAARSTLAAAEPAAPATAPLELAQRKSRPEQKAPPRPQAPRAEPPALRESIEADVSTRTIAVTSAFTGTEIVVFGSVVNSRQPSAEAGYYDVIVVLEGMATPLVVRKKSNVAGLWVNTQAMAFEGAPSYYAIASTRPIEEIADEALLRTHAIGLDFARLSPAARSVIESGAGLLRDFKDAVIRLKQREGLYLKKDYAVVFMGKSLFRAAIALPANVPVGPLAARVYLFREGELLSTFQSRVRLEREGIELWLYRFAMRHPVYYGLLAVLVAVVAGLLASTLFRRRDTA